MDVSGSYQLLLISNSSTLQIIGGGLIIGLLALLPLLGISMYLAQVRRWVTRLSITPSSSNAYATPTDRQRAYIERYLPDSASNIRIYVNKTTTESVEADAMGFLINILGYMELGQRSIVFSKAAFQPENRSKLPGLVAHEFEHFKRKDTRNRAVLTGIGGICTFGGFVVLFYIPQTIGWNLWFIIGCLAVIIAGVVLLQLSSLLQRHAEYRADAAASAHASRRSVVELIDDYPEHDSSESQVSDDKLLGSTHPTPQKRIGELTKQQSECEEL